MASGVLPLLVGKATRLARFMADDEKRYEATVRLGVATDTRDAMGTPEGPRWNGPWPDRDAIEQTLRPFTGTYLQQPPVYSAKKVGGQRSYRLARAQARKVADGRDGAVDAATLPPVLPLPAPAEVTAFAISVLEATDDCVRLEVVCSSGFYVRSLAHDFGRALGTAAHLTALRRTATSGVTLADAITLDALKTAAFPDAAARVLPMGRLLPSLPGVQLTRAGVERIAQGRDVGPADASSWLPSDSRASHYRVLDGHGELVAIGEPATVSGLLHPTVVLR